MPAPMTTDVTVVMVPFPAQGHLNQLLHFSIALSHHGLPVHYAAPASHIHQATSRLQGWPASALDSLHFHQLPVPPFDSPVPSSDPLVFFPSHLQPLFKAFEHARPHLADLLRSLSATSRRVIVISDLLVSFAATETAELPNAEPYTYQCVPPSLSLPWDDDQDSSASALLQSLGLDAPSTDDCLSEEFDALMVRNGSKPESGLLMNTCPSIEGELLEHCMKKLQLQGKKVFAVGPVNPTVLITEPTGIIRRHHSLEWLDEQPPSSVLYISFGSNSSVADAQMKQLAIGLLNSGQRFIWVLREADRCDGSMNGRQDKLPPGFTGKINSKGIIIGDWAPQLEILAHESVACFMSHCGWNSCVESISMGVPLLAWPMHSDQPWNSVLVSQYLKVGMIVRDWERRREILSAAHIEEAVKEVMVHDKGEEIRRRARELRDAVRREAADGGCSHTQLLSFIQHITRS